MCSSSISAMSSPAVALALESATAALRALVAGPLPRLLLLDLLSFLQLARQRPGRPVLAVGGVHAAGGGRVGHLDLALARRALLLLLLRLSRGDRLDGHHHHV